MAKMKEPIPSKCEYLWQQTEEIKRCRHSENTQPNMKLDGITEGFCTEDKCPLKKEPTIEKIMNDLIKIHIFMCGLIQHHLTPEIKTELKEYIKSWSLMLEE